MRKLIAFLLLLAVYTAGLYTGYKIFFKNAPAIQGEVIDFDFLNSAIGLKLKATPVQYGSIIDKFYFAPAPSEVYALIQRVKPPLTYRAEVWDCDDYAFWFRGELARQWAAEGNTLPLPIVTVHAVIVTRQGEVYGHAFNGIVMSTGKVVWIEPQGPWIYRHLAIMTAMAVIV